MYIVRNTIYIIINYIRVVFYYDIFDILPLNLSTAIWGLKVLQRNVNDPKDTTNDHTDTANDTKGATKTVLYITVYGN